MSVLVIGLVAALALALMFGLAHGTAAAQRFGNAFQHARNQAELGFEWFMDQYEEHIQPLIRNMGWVAMTFLVVSGSSVFVVPKATWLSIVVFLLSAGGFTMLWRAMQRTPGQFSAFSLASWIFLSYLGVGIALFWAGIASNERRLAVLGVAYILCAREVLFLEISVAGYAFWLGIKTIEGSGNLVFKIAIGLLTSGKQSLATLIGPDGIDVFPEQKIGPAIQSVKYRINIALYPVLAIGILTVNDVAVGLTLLAGLVSYFVWGNLAGEGINITSRRQRAAQLLEILAYALLAVAALVALVPGFARAFDAQMVAIKTWVVNLIDCKVGVMLPSLKTALAGLIITGLVLGYVYPWKNDAKLPGTRKLVAVPFGILAIVCLVGGTVSLLSKGSSDTVAVCGLSLSQAQAPVVTLENGRPRLTWTEARNAAEYRLERRAVNETAFQPVSGGTSIKSGVTTWIDNDLTAKGEFYYRLIVVYSDGHLSAPSPEVSVVIAPPPVRTQPRSDGSSSPKASASTSIAPSASQTVASTICADGSCDPLAKATKEMCAIVGCD